MHAAILGTLLVFDVNEFDERNILGFEPDIKGSAIDLATRVCSNCTQFGDRRVIIRDLYTLALKQGVLYTVEFAAAADGPLFDGDAILFVKINLYKNANPGSTA